MSDHSVRQESRRESFIKLFEDDLAYYHKRGKSDSWLIMQALKRAVAYAHSPAHEFGPMRTTVPADPLPAERFSALVPELRNQLLKRVFGVTNKTYRVCKRCGRSDVYLASLGVVEGAKCQ